MEFERVVRGRQMTRAFTGERLPDGLVDEFLDLARGAPSAGNTSALDFLVLEGGDTAAYWDITLAPDRRADFAWPQLLEAPVLVVLWVDPDAYVRRYAEADKAYSGLGAGQEAWNVPYWFVDGGAAAMTLLHAAEDRGLGALFFALFEHEDSVRDHFGVPASRRAVGTVALGYKGPDRPSSSASQARPALDEIVHRGTWGQ